MSAVYFVRHVMAAGNLARTFQGRIETQLVPEGERQLECLTKRFSDIEVDIIYSSPISRAEKTANAIKSGCGASIITDNRLMEIAAGDWEGMPIANFEKSHPTEWSLWTKDFKNFKAPNGESVAEVTDRMQEAFFEIIKKESGKNIVIVSHGAALRALMMKLFGDRYFKAFSGRPIIANGSISLYIPEEDEVKYIDDCEHLKD